MLFIDSDFPDQAALFGLIGLLRTKGPNNEDVVAEQMAARGLLEIAVASFGLETIRTWFARMLPAKNEDISISPLEDGMLEFNVGVHTHVTVFITPEQFDVTSAEGRQRFAAYHALVNMIRQVPVSSDNPEDGRTFGPFRIYCDESDGPKWEAVSRRWEGVSRAQK